MNIVEFTEFLVKSLVSNVDSVSVKEFDSDEESTILIQVLVDNNDMGKVIGKQGRIAKAIRTVMKSVAAKENKKVSVDFIEN